MRNKLILGLMVVVVIAIGAGLLLKTTANKTTNQTNTQNQTSNTDSKQKVTNSYVNVLATGFEPKIITIKKGVRVVWVNKSEKDVSINSDQHPTHTIWPFLNLGSFSNNSGVSVVFEKTGRYTYHNHYNPEQKGTVIVK